MGAFSSIGGAAQRPVVLKLRHAGYGVRGVVAGSPSVYLPLARSTHPAGRGKVLGPDTQILIDGFTRSSSTFAVFAFQLAQPAPVRVARHLHATAHVIAAVRRGVPALVPVRDPESTVLSVAVREPHISMTQALRSYVRFYTQLHSYRADVVAARFEEVTGDFGAVIHRVNQFFGTSFAEFAHTEDNVAECFKLIEYRSRKGPWAAVLADWQSGLATYQKLCEAIAGGGQDPGRALSERWVARPSAKRRAMKAALSARLQADGLASLRARAWRAYDDFVDGARGPGDTGPGRVAAGGHN
jgi:hypothetical protein